MRKWRIPLAFGAAILVLFLLAAFFPALFTQYGQKEMFGPWLAASPEHLLGTNALGYDIFTELVYGTRQTLLVGLTSSILTLLLGSVIGTFAAGKGGVYCTASVSPVQMLLSQNRALEPASYSPESSLYLH